ncbi:hydroxymethylglutaryl-CoA lyase [Sporosarcina siberiensis]|uniref:Hydroxymethylglutaryl-CoA lyase n=1 Tax=Sporosarcina siberiensis TaxID=1365606 RepID=A0ABW4SGP1_9BACL
MFILPEEVTLIEVGPRDGLQNESKHVQEKDKIAFIHALQEAGITEMELTSFVSPKWVPQMADAAHIVKKTKKVGKQIVLAPNEKGANLALEAGARSIAVFVGVSNSFNKNNINRTTDESIEALKPVILKLKEQGIYVRACISTAFYCPFEGKINPDSVVELCLRFIEMGIDELSVADTVGRANPRESFELFKKLIDELPNVLLTAHFHDTRKMALANIFAAMQAGIDRFDSSAGGLGGCPFSPGATGNVATEDVAHMMDSLNIHTGISVKKVCEAVAVIAPHVSHPIDTGMYRLFLNAQL